MDVFASLFGLSLGLGLCYLKQYQRNRQLKLMLNSFSQGEAEESDLPLISRLRREIVRTNEQHQHLQDELSVWMQVLDAAPVGYLQVDEENQLLWCNRCSRKLLKINRWHPGELRLLLELVRSYELDRLIEQTRQGQLPQVQEWVFQTTQLPLEATSPSPKTSAAHSTALRASSIPLTGGQVGVFLEDRQFALELTQARDRAFSDLTHELRTPLTSISLVAEALQHRLQGTERTWVDKMLQETHRLISLVQDCLEISRLQKSSPEALSCEAIALKGLIFELWQTLEPLAASKGIRLDYCGPDAIALQGDRARLTQVFLNLFDNSIQYSPPQSAIRVEVETVQTDEPQDAIEGLCDRRANQKGWIIINVIDSGCGFKESDLPHVFDRLYRGEQSRTRQRSQDYPTTVVPPGGSGLGLSIARQIIQAHGGSITAQNHPTTQGAWLQIKFPNII